MTWEMHRGASIRQERRTLLTWNLATFPEDCELLCFWEELAEYFIVAEEVECQPNLAT